MTADARLRKKRSVKSRYGPAILKPLLVLWKISGHLCSKRLRVFIDQQLAVISSYRQIEVSEKIYDDLMAISPATIDRLLRSVKNKYRLKNRATTKPGTILKHQIPIRTFTDWDENKVGFLEIDLVSHDGGSSDGEHCYTLNTTDVKSGWVEARAIKNKAQKWAIEALAVIYDALPFKIKGLDSDNGSEFINDHVKAFCDVRKITFTRSRPYRKNDSCYVEQKNYTIARQTVGWGRYEEDALETMNELYRLVCLHANYYQPSMKLLSKERIGARVIKKYSKPQTPFERVMLDDSVSKSEKERIRDIQGQLNLVRLVQGIEKLKRELARKTKKVPVRGIKNITLPRRELYNGADDDILKNRPNIGRLSLNKDG
ncbi:MAG: DDE-type integrase/transposase/recombinase [Patescibacteria group bacterium]